MNLENHLAGGQHIIRGDGLKVLASLPPASVDFLLTDPPYGVTKLEWDHAVNWPEFWELAHRACKPTATMAIFLTQPAAQPMIQANRGAFRYELIWQKNCPTGFLDAHRRPLRAHENIYIFCREFGGSGGFKAIYNPQMREGTPYKRGARKARQYAHYGKVIPASSGRSDGKRFPISVLYFGRPASPEHPTQKPIKLIRWLVATYSHPGGLVIDPYSGSGTTAVACAELGRNCLGVDLSAKFCAIARRRVTEALEAGPLPEGAMAFDLVHPSQFHAHPPVKIYPLDQVPFIKVA